MIATQDFAAALKEYLTEIFKQPVEARQQMIKLGEYADIFIRTRFTAEETLRYYSEVS